MNGARSRLWSFFSPAIAGFLCAIAAAWFPAAAQSGPRNPAPGQAEFGSVFPAPASARGGVGSSVTLADGALAGDRPGADRQCVDCPRSFLFAIGAEPVASSGALAMHEGRPHHGGRHSLHHGMGRGGKGLCPQTRTVPQAPKEYLDKTNPLQSNPENLTKGESLFQTQAQPTACKICHGASGNGMGMMAQGLAAVPRNFNCAETMKEIPDGQMFWIIKNGSAATGMPSYKFLDDNQIWELVLYLRGLTGAQ